MMSSSAAAASSRSPPRPVEPASASSTRALRSEESASVGAKVRHSPTSSQMTMPKPWIATEIIAFGPRRSQWSTTPACATSPMTGTRRLRTQLPHTAWSCARAGAVALETRICGYTMQFRLPAPIRRKTGPGQYRCGKCGERMFVRRRSIDRVRRYGCEKRPGAAGCGSSHIIADPLDEHVRDAVLSYLDSPDMVAAIEAHEKRTDSVDMDALHADESSLEELSRGYYTDRLISRSEFLAAREALEARIRDARRRLARTNGTGALRGLSGFGAKLREAWAGEDLEWRRKVLATVVDRVVIGPATPGLNYFDPTRATIEWKV